MKEKQWEKQVINFIRKQYKAIVINIEPSMTSGAGLPDLMIMVRNPLTKEKITTFLELKIKPNRATPIQLQVLFQLKSHNNIANLFFHSKNWMENLDPENPYSPLFYQQYLPKLPTQPKSKYQEQKNVSK